MTQGRRGPVLGNPGSDHPYYGKGGWGDLMYGRRYYVTEKGNHYYLNSSSFLGGNTQFELWDDALFEQEPKTRAGYVDRTNDLFNSRQTTQDHHAAEFWAAEHLAAGNISTDASKEIEG